MALRNTNQTPLAEGPALVLTSVHNDVQQGYGKDRRVVIGMLSGLTRTALHASRRNPSSPEISRRTTWTSATYVAAVPEAYETERMRSSRPGCRTRRRSQRPSR